MILKKRQAQTPQGYREGHSYQRISSQNQESDIKRLQSSIIEKIEENRFLAKSSMNAEQKLSNQIQDLQKEIEQLHNEIKNKDQILIDIVKGLGVNDQVSKLIESLEQMRNQLEKKEKKLYEKYNNIEVEAQKNADDLKRKLLQLDDNYLQIIKIKDQQLQRLIQGQSVIPKDHRVHIKTQLDENEKIVKLTEHSKNLEDKMNEQRCMIEQLQKKINGISNSNKKFLSELNFPSSTSLGDKQTQVSKSDPRIDQLIKEFEHQEQQIDEVNEYIASYTNIHDLPQEDLNVSQMLSIKAENVAEGQIQVGKIITLIHQLRSKDLHVINFN